MRIAFKITKFPVFILILILSMCFYSGCTSSAGTKNNEGYVQQRKPKTTDARYTVNAEKGLNKINNTEGSDSSSNSRESITEALKKEREESNNNILDNYGDQRIFKSYRNIFQIVYTSNYILKGKPIAIKYISTSDNIYLDNLYTYAKNRKIKNRRALLVEFEGFIYHKKGYKVKDWEDKYFIYYISPDLVEKSDLSDQELKYYIGKSHYFSCNIKYYLSGSYGNIPLCPSTMAYPPLRPIPSDTYPEIRAAIEKIKAGKLPNPKYCEIKIKYDKQIDSCEDN